MAIVEYRKDDAIDEMRKTMNWLVGLWSDEDAASAITKTNMIRSFLDGARRLRSAMELTDMEMTACPEAVEFAMEDERTGQEERFEEEIDLFSGEKDGYEYRLYMVRTVDEVYGTPAIGVGLKRRDSDGRVSQFNGPGKWSRPFPAEKEKPSNSYYRADGPLVSMAMKSMGAASLLNAYGNQSSESLDERTALKVVLRNASLIRLFDENGVSVSMKDATGNPKAVLGYPGHGVSVKQTARNEFRIGIDLFEWKDEDETHFEHDSGIVLNYDETADFIRKARKTEYCLPFSKDLVYRTGSLFDSEKTGKTVGELKELAKRTDDEKTAAAVLEVAKMAEKYAR